MDKSDYVYCKCGAKMELVDSRLNKKRLLSIFWGIHNDPVECGKPAA